MDKKLEFKEFQAYILLELWLQTFCSLFVIIIQLD